MIVELLGFVIHFQTRTKVKSQFCKQRCIDAFGTAGNGGDVMVAQCEHYTYDAHVIEFMVLLSYQLSIIWVMGCKTRVTELEGDTLMVIV